MSMLHVSPWEGFVYYTQSIMELWQQKAVVSSCIAGFVSVFGGDAFLLWALLSIMIADFAFGFTDAARRKHIRCRLLARGALKFVYYFSYLALVGVVNVSLSRSVGVELLLLNLFASYLIITDVISVLAHMQRLGIPVPVLLRRIVLKSRAKIERDVDEAIDRNKGRGHDE
ncbi:phage holin family protein [uncultured Bilophila sp.]|uniref:phage holin family protein n=1 Tax=uncultured Bilophila sp. TaxID=529385 RepID=UPI0026DD7891|nr:phage holin family protein [uncultured Bilophila sp.]